MSSNVHTVYSEEWAAAEGISKPLRVLVTGASGFVGSHVVGLLEDRDGFEVVSPSLSHLMPADVVISLAATGDPRDALRDPVGAYENNVRIMIQTLEYARRVGARVLHVSSAEVYGTDSGPAYAPRGPYAGAKACQEMICETYQDVPVTVVVTQSLFGERQQRDKLVPMSMRALLNDKPVTLQRSGLTYAARPFLHARNFADALAHIATMDKPPKRVHIGAETSLSLRYVIEILARAIDVEPRIEDIPAGDRSGHELVVKPIRCDLQGWAPTYETLPALVDVACWYRDNPDWLP